jgi:hypothetical protein
MGGVGTWPAGVGGERNGRTSAPSQSLRPARWVTLTGNRCPAIIAHPQGVTTMQPKHNMGVVAIARHRRPLSDNVNKASQEQY